MPRKTLTLIAVITLALCAVVTYEVTIPNFMAKKYTKDMTASTEKLHKSLETVAGSTKKEIFSTTTTTSEDNLKDIESIKGNISDANAALSNFNKANDLPKLPGSGLFGKYKTAHTEQQKAKDTATEVEKRLKSYNKLATFLEGFTKANTTLSDAAQGAYTDTETEVDFVKALRAEANAFRNFGTEVAKLDIPEELKADITKGTDLYKKYADLMDKYTDAYEDGDELAAGDIGIEALDLQNEFDDLTAATNEKTTQNSPLIKPIVELPNLTKTLTFKK